MLRMRAEKLRAGTRKCACLQAEAEEYTRQERAQVTAGRLPLFMCGGRLRQQHVPCNGDRDRQDLPLLPPGKRAPLRL